MLYKSLNFKAAGDGLAESEFAGYASTFGNVDDDGDIIQRGAFTLCLNDFQQSGVVCWQHRMSEPIGKPVECREDEKGLYLKGRISDTERGRDALTLLRDGVVRKMSIGFRIEAYTMLSKEQGVALLGQEAYDAALRALPWWSDGLRLITQIKLYEVSLVTVPANDQADILGVKSADGRLPETEREFERMLRDAGYPRKAAVALTNHGFKALLGAEGAPAPGDDSDNELQRDAAGEQALAASLKGLRAALTAS